MSRTRIYPSERLDPLDRGDLACLHIQLVGIVQRQVDPEQLIPDGDGEEERVGEGPAR